jgi:hypothetical protein
LAGKPFHWFGRVDLITWSFRRETGGSSCSNFQLFTYWRIKTETF